MSRFDPTLRSKAFTSLVRLFGSNIHKIKGSSRSLLDLLTWLSLWLNLPHKDSMGWAMHTSFIWHATVDGGPFWKRLASTASSFMCPFCSRLLECRVSRCVHNLQWPCVLKWSKDNLYEFYHIYDKHRSPWKCPLELFIK